MFFMTFSIFDCFDILRLGFPTENLGSRLDYIKVLDLLALEPDQLEARSKILTIMSLKPSEKACVCIWRLMK